MASDESSDAMGSQELKSSVYPSQRTWYSCTLRPSPRSFIRQSVIQLTERPSAPVLTRFLPRFSSPSDARDSVDIDMLRSGSALPFGRLREPLLSSVLPVGSEQVGHRTFFEGSTLTAGGRQLRQYLQYQAQQNAKQYHMGGNEGNEAAGVLFSGSESRQR